MGANPSRPNRSNTPPPGRRRRRNNSDTPPRNRNRNRNRNNTPPPRRNDESLSGLDLHVLHNPPRNNPPRNASHTVVPTQNTPHMPGWAMNILHTPPPRPTTPAPKRNLDEIYNSKIEKGGLSTDNCSICLEPIEVKDSVKLKNPVVNPSTLLPSPCDHKFHKDCILKWAKTSGKHNDGIPLIQCPLCKAFAFGRKRKSRSKRRRSKRRRSKRRRSKRRTYSI